MAVRSQKNQRKYQFLLRCIRDKDDAGNEIDRISGRAFNDPEPKTIKSVNTILKDVQNDGDAALIRYTEKFDKFKPLPLTVPPESLKEAWDKIPNKLQDALKLAKSRIQAFHELQVPSDIHFTGPYGETLTRRWSPVQRAGIYIPGGRASYPSTVLMNGIAANVAGVGEIIMASPAQANGQIDATVLAAAHLIGIKKVIRVGGAQAIGAFTYGTQTIPKVDVITGPGNIYVTLAKKAIYGQVGLDSLAGPSEVVIIADQTAQLEQVATDLLAQAEHDPMAASILLTTEPDLAKKIPLEINRQLQNHPRAEICAASLNNWGLIVICENVNSCIQLSNQFAPEHLEIIVKDPQTLIKGIKNAGAIFVGPWTPEAVGDYLAGPNHTLPTSGAARFSGALGVETFMKNTSLIEFNENSFKATSDSVIELANSEGLTSHADSIRIRN